MLCPGCRPLGKEARGLGAGRAETREPEGNPETPVSPLRAGWRGWEGGRGAQEEWAALLSSLSLPGTSSGEPTQS